MPWRLVVWVVPLLTMAAASAWQCRFGRTCFVLVAATFGCCGFVLGSHAREEALETPLKAAVTEDVREPVLARFRLTEDAASDRDSATLPALVRSLGGAVTLRVAAPSALASAIVSALLIGDRSGLQDDVRLRLQTAGTYHVIAISGGILAILTTFLLASLVPIGLSGRRAAF